MTQPRTTCIFVGSGFSKAIFGQKLQHGFTEDLLTLPVARQFLGDELILLLEKIRDIELVMSHFHNLAYSSQRADNPKRNQHIRDIIFLRTAIAVYFRARFHDLTSDYTNVHKPLLATFFERNQFTTNDIFFVTTNYDLGIETLIKDMFGEAEYYYPGEGFSKQRSINNAIPIFKLHGSINWMENRGPISEELFLNSYRDDLRVETEILGSLETAPLPRSQKLSLQHPNGHKYTPILIPFFYQKDEWLAQNKGWQLLFTITWNQARIYMENATRVFFWGYGLPPADHYLFTFLLNIIEARVPHCTVVDSSPDKPLDTMLARLLRYCYDGKEDRYFEHKNGLIKFLTDQ